MNIGEKIGELKGRLTTRRVLPDPKSGVHQEVSFQEEGTILGVRVKDVGTYEGCRRPDGRLYGEGQGMMMSDDGEAAIWRGQGLGRLKGADDVTWTGSLYFETSSAKLARLNGVIGLFKHSCDADGNIRTEIFELKLTE